MGESDYSANRLEKRPQQRRTGQFFVTELSKTKTYGDFFSYKN